MRIISLLASGTEIVCALGRGADLVARSHECDNPSWVRRLPSCTAPAFDVNVSSGQIDAEVRRRLKFSEPLYHIDTPLIQSLKPDLLITQEHCEVCAVTPGNVDRAGCGQLAAQILALSAGSVAGIYAGIRTIAVALHVSGDDLINSMQQRIAAVAASVSDRRAPTVVMLEWTDPPFVVGNWGPELIEAAHAVPLLGSPTRHSAAVSWDAVRAADPDWLIVAPCGFDLPRSLAERPFLEHLPGWSDLRAVQTGHVAFADGNRYFNRSGTTIVESVEILAEILHGRQSAPTWRKIAWRPYPLDATTARISP